jgi:hypothetical protein
VREAQVETPAAQAQVAVEAAGLQL